MDSSENDVTGKEILQHLKSIESRISQIETYLDLPSAKTEEDVEEETIIRKKKSETDEELELRIGQFWFAKLGIFVFLAGWLIGNTLPFEEVNQTLIVVIGFITGLVTIFAGIFFKNKFPHISGWILGSGFAIIYIAALRMHYFSPTPLVTDIIPIIVIVYIVSFALILSGIKWGSTYITAFGFALGYSSALIGDYSILIFLTITLLAIQSSYLKTKLNWNGLFNFTIVTAYLVHLIWFINNPLVGNQLELQIDQPLNLIFILLYVIIFTIAYFQTKEYDESLPTAMSFLANTSMGYGLFLLITILSAPSLGQVYHLLASIIFLGFAILFFTKKTSKVATFYYAMTGYAALSIAIILQFDMPDFFMWLCFQSLLVVSTAVWFRSKFIIVANFIIFIINFLSLS